MKVPKIYDRLTVLHAQLRNEAERGQRARRVAGRTAVRGRAVDARDARQVGVAQPAQQPCAVGHDQAGSLRFTHLDGL